MYVDVVVHKVWEIAFGSVVVRMQYIGWCSYNGQWMGVSAWD